MAILELEKKESTNGFAKEIDEAGMSMVFDNLQVHQYIKPIQSTVREIACNALDSVKERDAAREILTGIKKEEDYFLRRDEALYKDSNFDPSYYDLKHLSDKKDILITYHAHGTTGEKDFISFKDWGVGLGGKRLQNSIQKLAWSTKRNSKLTIGKFGIGAKAPLSTGVASFRTISVYNGHKFTIDVFSHKFESVTPKFNLETRTKNNFVVWKGKTIEGLDHSEEVYYEEVDEKNSVEIIVVTKKHHKQQYIDAIQSQLLYLQGIKFITVDEAGYEINIEVTAPILYEDDKIILADNRQYSKPHIIIDKVNYGYVDFQELELENKLGNVGIKVAAHEVSVNPSRESVIWNEQTRETVITRFKEVVGIASDYVTDSLEEKFFTTWLQKCHETLSYSGDKNSILGRLSALINKEDISPTFISDKRIRFKQLSYFFTGFKIRFVTEEYDSDKGRNTIRRIKATTWTSVNFEYIYLQLKNTAHTKDLYLYHLSDQKNILIVEPVPLDTGKSYSDAFEQDYIDYQKVILKQLEQVNDYDAVEVPEDWKKKLEESEKVQEIEDKVEIVMSNADRRKLNELTNFTSPEQRNKWDTTMVYRSQEWKISKIENLTNPVIYGFAEDRDLLTFVYRYISHNKLENDINLISIAKQNEKYYQKHDHCSYVKDIFQQLDPETNIIIVNDLIKTYNTVRLISNEFSKLNFMVNYEGIDQEIAEAYDKIRIYRQYGDISNLRHAAKEEIDKYLDKVIDFQLFAINAEDNPTAIALKSKELFGSPDFKGASVVDLDIYNTYKELLAYAEPLYLILNEMEPLTHSGNIPVDLEQSIQQYVNYKLNLQ